MNRTTAGSVLAAAAAALLAWGIVETTRSVGVGRCVGTFETCGPDPVHISAMVLGTLLFIASGFLAPAWAWLVGPPVGLVVAGGLLVAGGAEVDAGFLGMAGFIAVCVLLGPAIIAGFMLRGRAKQAKANQLVATGAKGVAVVQGARQTGLYVNNRPQVEVQYLVHPLGGGQPFATSKKQLIDFGGVQPRPGLTWPCWYDPTDPQTCAIGAPSGYTPETQQLLAEFGISPAQAFGHDPTGGVGVTPGSR